jgi:alpha-ketoglutarate-dependent taurine dioxygenase
VIGQEYDLAPADDADWSRAIENNWHTDVTFVHNPPLGSILKAVEIPTYGGDTAWTNLVAAYDGLSQPLKELVGGLHAVHRNEILVELGSPQGLALRSAFTSSPYWTEHPVVRVHPETGEKALFVNPNFTSHLVGLRNKESRALLALLYDHIADPRFTVRFRWAPGSIAFWDNRATAHLAAFDGVRGEPRTLHRITIAGDVPVGPDGFESVALEGGAFS